MRVIKTIQDVVDWGLCTGCGICSYICNRKGAIELVNLEEIGIRPKFNRTICKECSDCLEFCPGFSIDANVDEKNSIKPHKNLIIGDNYGIYEGYAKDVNIRYHGSSGGIITAIATYCLEKKNFQQIIIMPG